MPAMSILTGKPTTSRPRRAIAVVPSEADRLRAQVDAGRAELERLSADLAAERGRREALAAEAAALRAEIAAGNARIAALLEQLLARPAPEAPAEVDLTPVLGKIESTTAGTMASVKSLGDRLETALAAQTQQLLAGTPAPDELEFYVRRDDSGQVSTIIAKGKP